MKIIVAGNFAQWLVNFRGGLLKKMVARGHQVYACAPGASPAVRNFLYREGITYFDIPLYREGLHPKREVETFSAYLRMLRKIKPHVFLGYTVKPVIYGSIAAKITGVPRIFSMIEGLGYAFSRDRDSSKLLRYATVFLYAAAMRVCTRVFFLNRDDFDFFCHHNILPYRNKGVLLNGIGVDFSFFSPLPYREKQGVNFLFAARLMYEKGIAEYVAAAQKLKRRFADVRFFVAGWIDDNPSAVSREVLSRWIAEGSIEYLGMLEDVREAMAQVLVLVLPTCYREGLPRSILEAMATGRAVITTDIPGCNDAVDEGVTGFLVRPGDSDMLVDRMERLILDKTLALTMGEKGRRKAVSLFDENRVNEIIVKVIEE